MTTNQLTWHISSYSSGSGNCVEAAETPHTAFIRDTHHRELGHLTFPVQEWGRFLEALKERKLS
ncbi:DUF397 domain-containing protein [Salinactinospora qingdaonensis]|uniref:DUF397 domain-containing protein n=1 Tax=Salinactinospora qingdaonensis TaxID=702744 RepID=A0ABP7G0M7_9ACTN